MEARPEDFDLTSGFRLIRRRIVFIVVLALLITAALLPAILGIKPVYHADARLIIRNSLASALDAQEAGRTDTLELSSEIERMLARSTSERMVRDLSLSDREEFNPALRQPGVVAQLREAVRNLIGSSAGAPSLSSDSERVIEEYERALSVNRDPISNVIQIGFTSQDPQLAAAVPNQLLRVYLDERGANERRRLEATQHWVENRIAEQQDRVEAARAAVQSYRESRGAMSLDGRTEQVSAAADLNAKLGDIAQSTKETLTTIAALQGAGREQALQEIVVPDSVAELQRQVGREQLDLDRLLKTFGNGADEVASQKQKVEATRLALDLEVSRFVQSERAKLASLNRESREVSEALRLAEDQLDRSAVAQADLAELVRTAATEQTALDKLEQRRRTLSDQAAMPETDVELLSPATVPLFPQGRGRLFYLIGAMLAAVSIATTVAFIREMLDQRVRSAQQLSRLPSLTPAGMLPIAPRQSAQRKRAGARLRYDGAFGEAIRSIIVSMKQSNDGVLPASLIVSSALGGEGKTFVARVLAAELVAAGQPVLLIDGDLVRGSLSAAFELEHAEGLSDYLSGDADAAAIIHHDASSGIDIIPRGRGRIRRGLYLADLSRLLKLAQSEARLVIIDSAPVLASTDTLYLAGQVERTLLVVQWARTRMRSVEFAADRLEGTSKGDVMVVMNRVNPKKHKLYGFKDAEMFAPSIQAYHNSV
ncbi:exopolysaccharide biosynthesis protein [Mesorhizobium sp. BR1-1-16]|uniref:GumC family protein n=1 Tax=Mesorhizobium sp. BR1-1-16 TaxID=2876653 RepID=UPI001CC9DB24|nr:polysaccharide biosynthesis tyrosine autokinase [Mesorhizobium sp. BR1-1-16]MBZ9936044.1 exopolysaccharide biosynthesis protein [Mesorhizobium sp. BR1-1-16]